MGVDVVKMMKISVVEDYFDLIKQLSKGNLTKDVSKIYAKILFIDSAINLDKVQFIYEKLI